jgi:hypothetical protein
MRLYKTLSTTLCMGLLVTVLAGCEREGPMERAGKKIDKAAEDLSEASRKEGPVERSGKQVDKAVEEANDALRDATRP